MSERKLLKADGLTFVPETTYTPHDGRAMVWVAEGDDMPESGRLYSFSRQDDTWTITSHQMLVSFYKNGSKLDWEISTEQSPAGDVLKAALEEYVLKRKYTLTEAQRH